MVRVQSLLKVTLSLALVTVLVVTSAQAQQGGRGRGLNRGSLLRLLSMDQVQAELKLTEAQMTKVQEVTDKLMGEVSEQASALREISDPAKRTEKMNEISTQMDGKLREQLRGVLEREQMMRLFQIRLQVNPVTDSLSNERLASRLGITDEQKSKLAEIKKELETKQTEIFGKMANASQDQRGAIFQELRQLRTDMDQKALGVLTDEQKKSFEEMKGKILELRRPGRGGN